MAVSPTYCTHRDLEDIYPNINDFDSKEAIYGWDIDNSLYIAYNVGLITQFFINGKNQISGKQTIGTSALTTINEGAEFSAIDTTLTVTDGTKITLDSYILIDSEILRVTGISTHELTVVRGELGTNATTHSDTTNIFQHFDPQANGDWLNDTTNDFIILKGSDPNDSLTEAGEDFSTLITRIMKNASRYFDARVDSRLPRDQWKDKEGNYDYIIVRTVALIAACFQIKSQDPNSEALAVLEEEYNLNIALINNGQVALSNQVTSDSSKGILREVVAPQDDNPLRIIDTRGNYHGIYDLIKIYIDTGEGGAIGTAKYSVKVGDSDGLKTNLIVDSEVIDGSYQTVGNGLQVRFAGKDDDSVATANDEWELEVWGKEEVEDNPIIKSVRMTRR
jgi:hypothetical protein